MIAITHRNTLLLLSSLHSLSFIQTQLQTCFFCFFHYFIHYIKSSIWYNHQIHLINSDGEKLHKSTLKNIQQMTEVWCILFFHPFSLFLLFRWQINTWFNSIQFNYYIHSFISLQMRIQINIIQFSSGNRISKVFSSLFLLSLADFDLSSLVHSISCPFIPFSVYSLHNPNHIWNHP